MEIIVNEKIMIDNEEIKQETTNQEVILKIIDNAINAQVAKKLNLDYDRDNIANHTPFQRLIIRTIEQAIDVEFIKQIQALSTKPDNEKIEEIQIEDNKDEIPF